MKNLQLPAYSFAAMNDNELRYASGLTKLELACIELRIPETGDPDLDSLIAKAQRRDLAAKAMAGLSSACVSQDGTWSHDAKTAAISAVEYADALLAELNTNQSNQQP